MQEQSNYYSIIPTPVLLDKDISDKAKLIYAELTSLDKKCGYAFCSNKYIAELFNIHPITVSKCIAELKNKGYIECEVNEDNSRKIFLVKGLVSSLRPISDTANTYKSYDLDPISEMANKESKEEKVELESKDNNNILPAKAGDTSFVKVNEFIDFFAKTCPSLPQIQIMSDKRKKALNNIIKQFGKDKLIKVLHKAEASDFLSGRNGKWNNCNIDWLLKPSNFIKIFEGNYDNSRNKETEDAKINREYKKTYIQEHQDNSKALKINRAFKQAHELKERWNAKQVKEKG